MISDPTLWLEPTTRQNLVAFGKDLPLRDVTELFGYDPYGVMAFSDYSGDDDSARFDTYATFVAGNLSLNPLLADLRAIHAQARGRVIDYKGRKDAVKRPLLRAQIEAFRKHRALLIILCFDKRMDTTPATLARKKELRGELRHHDLGIPAHVGDRAVKAIGFLCVIAHLLRPKDRLGWVSDPDAILQGAAGRELPRVLKTLANQVVPCALDKFGYFNGEPDTDHELLLSIVDLAAGSFAHGLPYDGAQFQPPDAEAGDIVRGFADFASSKATNTDCARIMPIVFRRRDDGRMWPNVIDLHPAS